MKRRGADESGVPASGEVPRYAEGVPLPRYRHRPGETPRPEEGVRTAGSVPLLASPKRWRESTEYLHAVDLFNHGYWWECHEKLEELWIAAGRKGRQAVFLRAVIQAAAANLKWDQGVSTAARSLARQACERLAQVRSGEGAGRYMGVDLEELERSLRRFHLEGGAGEPGGRPPVIRLG